MKNAFAIPTLSRPVLLSTVSREGGNVQPVHGHAAKERCCSQQLPSITRKQLTALNGPRKRSQFRVQCFPVHLGSKTKQGIVLAHDSETIGNVVISSEEMGKLCFLHWQKIFDFNKT